MPFCIKSLPVLPLFPLRTSPKLPGHSINSFGQCYGSGIRCLFVSNRCPYFLPSRYFFSTSSLVIISTVLGSVADPGSSAFLTPRIRDWLKNQGSGSAMNNPDYIFPRELTNFFWVKILKFFHSNPGSGIFLTLDPGTGIEKNSDMGSGINILDLQHC